MGYLVTTADFLADVKRDGLFPAAQVTFSDQELLAIGDDALYGDIFPLLKSFNEGFLLEFVDQNFVAGQSAYTLPKYAMWNAVYLVQRTISGAASYPDYIRIEIDQLKDFQTTTQGTSIAYYLLDNNVNFVPLPSGTTASGDAFRLWIYRRPGRMVTINQAAQVLSVNYGTGQVTYTAVPPVTFTATSVHDFYSATSPFKRLQTNITATNLAGAVQTFPIPSVQTLITGDWVCLLDETVIPPLPFELWNCLKELLIKSLMRTQMDAEAYQIQREFVMDCIKSANIVPGNRTVGRSKPLPLTSHPLIRRGRRLY